MSVGGTNLLRAYLRLRRPISLVTKRSGHQATGQNNFLVEFGVVGHDNLGIFILLLSLFR